MNIFVPIPKSARRTETFYNVGLAVKRRTDFMLVLLYFFWSFRINDFNTFSINICTFHYLSLTDSIKPGLQFSFFILVWLLSWNRLFTKSFVLIFVLQTANMILIYCSMSCKWLFGSFITESPLLAFADSTIQRILVTSQGLTLVSH